MDIDTVCTRSSKCKLDAAKIMVIDWDEWYKSFINFYAWCIRKGFNEPLKQLKKCRKESDENKSHDLLCELTRGKWRLNGTMVYKLLS